MKSNDKYFYKQLSEDLVLLAHPINSEMREQVMLKVLNDIANNVVDSKHFKGGVKVQILNLNENNEENHTSGKYYRGENRISVDIQDVNEFYRHHNISKIFKILGHELYHNWQYENLNNGEMIEQTYDAQNKLISDFNAKYLSKDAVKKMFDVFGERLVSSFEMYKKLSDEDKMDVCKKVAYSQYVSLVSENQAQKYGYEFASFLLNSLINDKFVDERYKNWFRKELEENEFQRKFDILTVGRNDNDLEAIKNAFIFMPYDEICVFIENMKKSIRSLELNAVNNSELLKELEAERILNNFLCSNVIYGFDKDDVQCLMLSAFSLGLDETFSEVLELYKKRADVNKGDVKAIEVSVLETLVNGDVPLTLYSKDYRAFCDNELIVDAYVSLADNEQYLKAFKLFDRNGFGYFSMSKNEIRKQQQVQKYMVNVAQNYFEELLNGKVTSELEFHEVMEAIVVYTNNKEGIELKSKILSEKEKGNINFVAKDKELDYLVSKYGESCYDEIKKELMNLEIFNETNQRKNKIDFIDMREQ